MSDALNEKKKDSKKDVGLGRITFTNIIPQHLRGVIKGITGIVKKEPYLSTNDKFHKEDQQFIKACENVGIKPTRRQASKWRNKKGLAYLKGRF